MEVGSGAKRPPTGLAAGDEKDPKVLGGKAVGPTYKMLKPEVKQTLEKVMY